MEKPDKEKIEEIVADIRNKLGSINSYFMIRKDLEHFDPDKREALEKILVDCEAQCNKALPKIIKQLENLNNI